MAEPVTTAPPEVQKAAEKPAVPRALEQPKLLGPAEQQLANRISRDGEPDQVLRDVAGEVPAEPSQPIEQKPKTSQELSEQLPPAVRTQVSAVIDIIAVPTQSSDERIDLSEAAGLGEQTRNLEQEYRGQFPQETQRPKIEILRDLSDALRRREQLKTQIVSDRSQLPKVNNITEQVGESQYTYGQLSERQEELEGAIADEERSMLRFLRSSKRLSLEKQLTEVRAAKERLGQNVNTVIAQDKQIDTASQALKGEALDPRNELAENPQIAQEVAETIKNNYEQLSQVIYADVVAKTLLQQPEDIQIALRELGADQSSKIFWERLSPRFDQDSTPTDRDLVLYRIYEDLAPKGEAAGRVASTLLIKNKELAMQYLRQGLEGADFAGKDKVLGNFEQVLETLPREFLTSIRNFSAQELDTWQDLQRNPTYAEFLSPELIRSVNEQLVILQNEEFSASEVNFGWSRFGAVTEAEFARLLTVPNEQTVGRAYLYLLAQGQDSDIYSRRFADFITSKEGHALWAKGSKGIIEEQQAGKLQPALKGHSVNQARMESREVLQKIVISSDSLLDKGLALMALRNSGDTEFLYSQFTQGGDPRLRELTASAIVYLGERGERQYFTQMLTGMGIASDQLPAVLEKLLQVFPVDKGDFHTNPSHYRFLKVLAENPVLMDKFSTGKRNPLESMPLMYKIIIRRDYSELGKVYSSLLTTDDPSVDSIFSFSQRLISWDSNDWDRYLSEANISLLDREQLWESLSPEERRLYGLELMKGVLGNVKEWSRDPTKKQAADSRNRSLIAEQQSEGTDPLVTGTLLHGTKIEVLDKLFRHGVKAGEFLGLDQSDDATPLGCDFSKVLEGDEYIKEGTKVKIADQFGDDSEALQSLEASSKFARKYYQSLSASYGAKPDVVRGIARDRKAGADTGVALIFDRSTEATYLKGIEYTGPMDGGNGKHALLAVGLPSTEISGLIVNGRAGRTLERAKGEIVKNGFYIPIYDVDGILLFTPEQYDAQRTTLADQLPAAA